MTLTDRIFDLLNKKGKTQTDIARLLNVRPTTVSEWKKGKYTPTVEHCVTLAEYFGVSLDYLITAHSPERAAIQGDCGALTASAVVVRVFSLTAL